MCDSFNLALRSEELTLEKRLWSHEAMGIALSIRRGVVRDIVWWSTSKRCSGEVKARWRRPSDIVRATSGRPLPARRAKCHDLAGAFAACTCHARALYAIRVAPGWVPAHAARAGTHLFSRAVPCRTRPWEVHARERRCGISHARISFPQDPLHTRSELAESSRHSTARTPGPAVRYRRNSRSSTS